MLPAPAELISAELTLPGRPGACRHVDRPTGSDRPRKAIGDLVKIANPARILPKRYRADLARVAAANPPVKGSNSSTSGRREV